MIKAIIFDCFGVLYRDNVSMLYDVMPPEKVRALQDIIHATDHGFLSREEYCQQIAELADKPVEIIYEIEKRQHVRDDAVVAYSQTFRTDYKVAVLSNIDTATMDRLFPEPERSQLFDAFVMSGAVGLAKPNPALFTHAAEQLGLRPEECVMIDDLEHNVDGAQVAGMNGLRFTSLTKLKTDLEQLIKDQANA